MTFSTWNGQFIKHDYFDKNDHFEQKRKFWSKIVIFKFPFIFVEIVRFLYLVVNLGSKIWDKIG